jgi:ubiquinone/menaquinone biosynthesis C-methylase UbiE
VAALYDAAAPGLDRGAIIDIGCGSGWWLEELARGGVASDRLHGVDLLAARVDAARDRVPAASVRRADARALPFEADRFALATLLVTLSSLPDARAVDAALKEARRVVAPGGRVLVYEPRYPNPFNEHTRLVRAAELRRHGRVASRRSVTVAPPLVRRLGAAAPRLYGALGATRLLRTHALTVLEVV